MGDRFVTGVYEDSGMAVEGSADRLAAPDRREDLLYHSLVGFEARLSLLVATLE